MRDASSLTRKYFVACSLFCRKRIMDALRPLTIACSISHVALAMSFDSEEANAKQFTWLIVTTGPGSAWWFLRSEWTRRRRIRPSQVLPATMRRRGWMPKKRNVFEKAKQWVTFLLKRVVLCESRYGMPLEVRAVKLDPWVRVELLQTASYSAGAPANADGDQS